jgi:hypothetical protein
MAIDLLEYKKLSEGVMIKRTDSPYDAPQNKAWAKFKRQYEIDGLVIQRNQTKVPTVFNYDLTVGPISAEYAKMIGDKARQFKDKWFMFIGTSDATTLKLTAGAILRVAAEEVIHHETDNPKFPYFTGYVMRVLEPVPEKSVPDPVLVLERLAALEPRRLPSVRKQLPTLELPEFVWIPSFISLAGSTIYHAEGFTDREPNDIDIILRANEDERGRFYLTLDPGFRLKLDRIMEANFGDKPTQYSTSPYGPNWDFLAIYDLVLRPRSPLEIEELEEDEFKDQFYKSTTETSKQEDPYMEYLPEQAKREFMMHLHYRGRGAHLDIRFEGPTSKYLIGWTISMQNPGVITESVDSLQAARRWFKNPDAWKIDFAEGRVKQRRVRGGQIRPAQLYASRKAKEPLPWMRFEGRVEPGEVGATKYEYGTFLIIEKGQIQTGTQKPYFHEYFLHGKIFSGRIAFRLLGRLEKDTRAPVFVDHAGFQQFGGLAKQARDVLPIGVASEDFRDPYFWSFMQPIDQRPYVLSPDAKEKKWMPPKGISALPEEIRSQLPLQYRYWNESGEAARTTRDMLIEDLGSGKMKLDFEKLLYGRQIQKAAYPYVLQWHYWKKVKVIRVGPSTQHWDLRIDFGKPPLFHLVLERDPLDSEEVSGYEKPSEERSAMERGAEKPEYLAPSGDAKEGQPGFNPWNPTKDTPAWVEMLDHGEVEVLERTPNLLKIQFTGGKMKGTWLLTREETGSNFWLMQHTREKPG